MKGEGEEREGWRGSRGRGGGRGGPRGGEGVTGEGWRGKGPVEGGGGQTGSRQDDQTLS